MRSSKEEACQRQLDGLSIRCRHAPCPQLRQCWCPAQRTYSLCHPQLLAVKKVATSFRYPTNHLHRKVLLVRCCPAAKEHYAHLKEEEQQGQTETDSLCQATIMHTGAITLSGTGTAITQPSRRRAIALPQNLNISWQVLLLCCVPGASRRRNHLHKHRVGGGRRRHIRGDLYIHIRQAAEK